jgi:hypothetical protein
MCVTVLYVIKLCMAVVAVDLPCSLCCMVTVLVVCLSSATISLPTCHCWVLLQGLNNRQVTAAITRCSSAQQLVRLIQQHLSSMDAISLSAAILKLSKLKCKEQQPYADCLQRYLPLAPVDTPRHLSNVIYALCTAPTLVMQQHCAAVKQLLPMFLAVLSSAIPQGISNVLYGVALSRQQLNEKAQLLEAEQLQQLLAAFVGKLEDAKPQEVSNTLWAVAKIQQQVPEGQLQQLLTAFVSVLQRAKPQEASNVLLACAKLRFPPQQLLAAPELVALLAAGTPQEMANAAWACGQLGHRDEHLMAALLVEVQQRLVAPGINNTCSTFTSQNLCNLCWSVAVLDMQQHAWQVPQLAQACSSQWDSVAPAELRQLWQVHTWLLNFQLAGAQGLQGSLTEQQLQQCREAWEQQMQDTLTQAPGQFQRSVFAAVQRLPIAWQQQPQMEQLSVGRDGVTPDGALLLDIAGRTAAGVLVAVEADGPSHFRQPDGGLTGATQWRNRALAVRGYRLVSVPYSAWDRLKGDAELQQQYLLRLFAEAEVH